MATKQKEWPALDSSYTDVYGPIDIMVYDAAQEIWPRARAFGEFALQDADAAFSLMLKAVAAVSARLNSPDQPEISLLKPYLFRTYKNLVAAEKSERMRVQSLDELDKSSAVDLVADLERKILLRELFSRMSEEERNICTYVMFGYRHNEIADILGMTPDAVRQKYSRLIRKLANMFSDSVSSGDENS